MPGPGYSGSDSELARLIEENERDRTRLDRMEQMGSTATVPAYANDADELRREYAQMIAGLRRERRLRRVVGAAAAADVKAAAADPSWWSKYGSTLTTGVANVASPWVQYGLKQAGLADSPSSSMTPTPSFTLPERKASSPWPWIIGGVGVLGLGVLLVAIAKRRS